MTIDLNALDPRRYEGWDGTLVLGTAGAFLVGLAVKANLILGAIETAADGGGAPEGSGASPQSGGASHDEAESRSGTPAERH